MHYEDGSRKELPAADLEAELHRIGAQLQDAAPVITLWASGMGRAAVEAVASLVVELRKAQGHKAGQTVHIIAGWEVSRDWLSDVVDKAGEAGVFPIVLELRHDDAVEFMSAQRLRRLINALFFYAEMLPAQVSGKAAADHSAADIAAGRSCFIVSSAAGLSRAGQGRAVGKSSRVLIDDPMIESLQTLSRHADYLPPKVHLYSTNKPGIYTHTIPRGRPNITRAERKRRDTKAKAARKARRRNRKK